MLPVVNSDQLEHGAQFVWQQISGLDTAIALESEAHEPGKRPKVPRKLVLDVLEQELLDEDEPLRVGLIPNEVDDEVVALLPRVHHMAEEEGRDLEFTDSAIAPAHGLKDGVAIAQVQ